MFTETEHDPELLKSWLGAWNKKFRIDNTELKDNRYLYSTNRKDALKLFTCLHIKNYTNKIQGILSHRCRVPYCANVGYCTSSHLPKLFPLNSIHLKGKDHCIVNGLNPFSSLP
jgi:hypothetical protein